MKSKLFLPTMALLFTATNVFSQIPNNGFELWNNLGNYMEPQGYQTTNSLAAGPFYPVTRSTDHYPSSAGNYSIRLENNIALLPNPDGFGIAMQTNNILTGPEPFFPVTDHPTSFTGYYKYLPQGNDTMFIQLILYQEGTAVA